MSGVIYDGASYHRCQIVVRRMSRNRIDRFARADRDPWYPAQAPVPHRARVGATDPATMARKANIVSATKWPVLRPICLRRVPIRNIDTIYTSLPPVPSGGRRARSSGRQVAAWLWGADGLRGAVGLWGA